MARSVARLDRTKNGDRRALALTYAALAEIKRLHADAEPHPLAFVFPKPDGSGPLDIRKHWQAAIAQAGIDDFRFHDLRHSAASYLAMNGATLAEIAEVLGHKTLQMVKRYAHMSDQHVAGVVERMNRAIFDDPANDDIPDEPRSKRSRR